MHSFRRLGLHSQTGRCRTIEVDSASMALYIKKWVRMSETEQDKLNQTAEVAGTDPVSILIVDDHQENLVALTAVLADLGQNIVQARSGKEALKHLLDKDFAII